MMTYVLGQYQTILLGPQLIDAVVPFFFLYTALPPIHSLPLNPYTGSQGVLESFPIDIGQRQGTP